jgi:hypothetical protein
MAFGAAQPAVDAELVRVLEPVVTARGQGRARHAQAGRELLLSRVLGRPPSKRPPQARGDAPAVDQGAQVGQQGGASLDPHGGYQVAPRRYGFTVDIAALVIALVALGISGASVVYARRQTRIAQRALELTEEDAGRYAAPWRLEHTRGDMYALVNDGNEAVFDVVIEAPETSIVRGEREYARIPAGSAATFMLVLVWGSPCSDITVSWSREPGGERHDWTYPLPVKSS